MLCRRLKGNIGCQLFGLSCALQWDLRVVISSQGCLSFDKQLNSIISACNNHLRAFCHIRPALTFDLATAIGQAIVLSHLDYCYSLLVGASTSAGCSKSLCSHHYKATYPIVLASLLLWQNYTGFLYAIGSNLNSLFWLTPLSWSASQNTWVTCLLGTLLQEHFIPPKNNNNNQNLFNLSNHSSQSDKSQKSW